MRMVATNVSRWQSGWLALIGVLSHVVYFLSYFFVLDA